MMRVASVCPSNTDLLAHLGALDLCVGRDTWSDWPDGEVDRIPVVGSVLNLNFEALSRCKPDLVLASLNVPGMEKVVAELTRRGFPLQIYDPETWDDVLENLVHLGDLIDRKDCAKALVQEAQEKVRTFRTITSEMRILPIMIEWWPTPIIAPFRETYVNDVLDWVGCRSILRFRPGRSGRVSEQEVWDATPELYAISWCGTKWEDYDTESVFSRFQGHPQVGFLSDRARVFKLWEGVIGHPSLRLLDGAQTILHRRLMLDL